MCKLNDVRQIMWDKRIPYKRSGVHPQKPRISRGVGLKPTKNAPSTILTVYLFILFCLIAKERLADDRFGYIMGLIEYLWLA